MIKNHSVFALLCKPIYRRYIDDCHRYTKIGSYYKTETGGQNDKHQERKRIAFLLKEPVFNVQDVDIIYVVSLSTTFFYALLQYLFVLTHVNMPFIIAA